MFVELTNMFINRTNRTDNMFITFVYYNFGVFRDK